MSLLRLGPNVIKESDETQKNQWFANSKQEAFNLKCTVKHRNLRDHIPKTVRTDHEFESVIRILEYMAFVWNTGTGDPNRTIFWARRKILCKRFSTKSRMALESRADSGLNPLITESHGGQNGMRASTA